jgi:hypothetical protein
MTEKNMFTLDINDFGEIALVPIIYTVRAEILYVARTEQAVCVV